jgi:hypothetical protein
MLQVFQMDIAKVDWGVVYVAITTTQNFTAVGKNA